jgi:hypothetical protein
MDSHFCLFDLLYISALNLVLLSICARIFVELTELRSIVQRLLHVSLAVGKVAFANFRDLQSAFVQHDDDDDNSVDAEVQRRIRICLAVAQDWDSLFTNDNNNCNNNNAVQTNFETSNVDDTNDNINNNNNNTTMNSEANEDIGVALPLDDVIPEATSTMSISTTTTAAPMSLKNPKQHNAPKKRPTSVDSTRETLTKRKQQILEQIDSDSADLRPPVSDRHADESNAGKKRRMKQETKDSIDALFADLI